MKTTRIIRRNVKKSRKASAAITTTIAGIVTYRTRRPLSEVRAVRFATMVQANPRFLDATVIPARKIGAFHVCFLPCSADRIAVMMNKENQKDIDAMNRDGRRFLYCPLSRPVALSGYTEVFSCRGITGEYETTLSNGGACCCPHYTFRRKVSGGECKHIKELRRRFDAGFLSLSESPVPVSPAITLPLPAPTPAPEVRAEARPVGCGGYGSAEWDRRVSADFD